MPFPSFFSIYDNEELSRLSYPSVIRVFLLIIAAEEKCRGGPLMTTLRGLFHDTMTWWWIALAPSSGIYSNLAPPPSFFFPAYYIIIFVLSLFPVFSFFSCSSKCCDLLYMWIAGDVLLLISNM